MCAAGILGWFSGSGSWDPNRFPAPWEDGRPIFEHVRANIGPNGKLLAAGAKLPDESRVLKGSRIRWAGGSMDAVLVHRAHPSDEKSIVSATLRRLELVLKRPDHTRLKALYGGLLVGGTLSYIDAFLKAIVEKGTLPRGRARGLARWIATQAPDREPVKFAIALLGIAGEADDAEVFLTLGRHDEFTLYALVALANTHPDPEGALWELARSVEGWGRVHAMERLSNTTNPEIQSWMLRDGYKNSIMLEYTACTCARAGGLAAALQADDIDEALFDGAGEIIVSLINGQGGPAEGIDDYADAPVAVARYLDHALRRDASIDHLMHVGTIRRFLQDASTDWSAGVRAVWNEKRDRLATGCALFIERPTWTERIRRALAEAQGFDFRIAAQAARVIGVDPWGDYFCRLQRGEDHWYFVMQTDDPARIDRVVEFATSAINLDGIATGPADELGLGPQWAEHRKLGWVLQDLRRFPGEGWPLIRAGLRSPVVPNRNMALRAIAAWSQAAWTDEIRAALAAAEEAEPDDQVRELIRSVRVGEYREP